MTEASELTTILSVCSSLYLFTGKERDQESGLDYFGARYYGSALGRFTSPDPHNASAMLEDPQSWNAYSYVRNNPLALVDPFGENYTVCDNQGQNCADLTDKQFQQYLNDNQNVSKGGNGTLTYYDDNGASHNIGTASYYNEKAFDGTAALTYLIGEDLKNAAFQVAGGLLGRAVGAALDARTATAVGGIGPVLKGAAGVEKAVAEIEAEGGQVVAREVTIQNSAGRARVDLAYKDSSGNLVLGEAKNGPTAALNPNQRAVYNAAQSEGAQLVGGNARNAGLPATVPPSTVRVFKY